MKVGIYIGRGLKPQTGGGYSYLNTLIKTLFELEENNNVEYKLIVESNIHLNLSSNISKNDILFLGSAFSILNRVFRFVRSSLSLPNRINKSISTFLGKLAERKFIRMHNEGKLDIIYYPNQHQCLTSNFPFILTNWDLGHRTISGFPEVTINGEFERRENFYQLIVPKAQMVFTESQAGVKELLSYYSELSTRFKSINIFPSDVINEKIGLVEQHEILDDLNLIKGKYFFYPAQFWAHKNHFGLVKAFRLFIDEDKFNDINLVFCGSDKGNKQRILELIDSERLDSKITVLKFISQKELFTLYKNALAMVMPTFLGPTNLPILEAMAIGCPVICSDFEGHREQAGDNPIYIDPFSIEDISNSFKTLLDWGASREERIKEGQLFFENGYYKVENVCANINRNIQEISTNQIFKSR